MARKLRVSAPMKVQLLELLATIGATRACCFMRATHVAVMRRVRGEHPAAVLAFEWFLAAVLSNVRA